MIIVQINLCDESSRPFLCSNVSDLVKALHLKDESSRIERVLLLIGVLLKQKLEFEIQPDYISQ